MSSTDESVRYVGESPGDHPFEATSRRSGSPCPLMLRVGGGAYAKRLAVCWMNPLKRRRMRRRVRLLGRGNLRPRRRESPLRTVGAALRGQPRLLVGLGSWAFTNSWRSLPFLRNTLSPSSP
ncbi:UNVERIFIED_CONTAM: hypothetical protein Sradi_0822200 [Sesamum radiatum]|uniref:Uncharacterized protein n=1 Tax=Sesamum radiatum TaxID=300843 RepID=A0AAW2VRW4_SESRA